MQMAAIEEEPPKLLMGDSTDSDSDESSEEDSEGLSSTGKSNKLLNY
jgi:hypothetical protein